MSGWDVVHVVPAAFDREDGVVGGAERYALELARAMAKRVRTALVAFGARPRSWHEGDLEVFVIRGYSVRGQQWNPWSPALVRWIRRARVVHCHQRAVIMSSTSALAGRAFGTPVFVSDLGGGGFDLSAYVDTTSWFRGHLHISEYSRRVSGHSTLASAHVVYGGVDTDRFSPPPDGPREPEALFVGRLLPHKGVNYLVDACADDVRLRVLGEPYDAAYAGSLRNAAGRGVAFQAGADDAALVEAYRRAAVCVLPSVYRTVYGDLTRVPELLGQTLLEAMACATPVIATEVASLPEVVLEGETGFLVPPNDPPALRDRIRWILAHPAESRRMGQAARRRVLEHFTWDRVVDACLRHYGLASSALEAPAP